MTLVISKTFTWWGPENISTALWLDAADATTITTVSGTVSQWNDKSGNNRNGTQSTAGSRPTVDATGLNSLPSISFDGSNDQLSFPTGFLNGTTAFTVAMVMSGPLQTNDAIWGPINVSNQGLEIAYLNVNSWPTGFRVNGTAKFTTGLWSTNSSPTITTVTASSSSTAGWLNGSTASAASSTGISALNFNGVYSLGSYANGQWAQMQMGEFIIIESSVSDLNRQKLEGYLAHKWGLTANLPSNHPYKISRPAP